MSDKAWKAAERAVAARLGGRRVPVTGRARGDAPDIAHSRFSLEVKERATLPRWLHDARDQARAAGKAGQIPAVVLHQLGRRHDADLVLLALKDFERLIDTDAPKETMSSERNEVC